MRFQGELNTDLNEITMNLVPFPRMHFLISALRYAERRAPISSAVVLHPQCILVCCCSPLYTLTLDGKSPAAVSRGIDHMFSDAFSADQQLIKVG